LAEAPSRNLQNYFNYYTEIEEHFQRRRGTLLMLTTLDWSLIAAWQEAGFPVEAVLAGIDATFEKYAARQAKGRVRRINGLAYCGQEVLRAMENMHAAAVGAAGQPRQNKNENGFEPAHLIAHLRRCAEELKTTLMIPADSRPILLQTGEMLVNLAATMQEDSAQKSEEQSAESLEKHLIALEDQIFSALQTFTAPEDLIALRERAAQELAPYRSRMQAMQIRQIEQQFLRRCLFERYSVPRLSLFYIRPT
jgi:hypothetical protein